MSDGGDIQPGIWAQGPTHARCVVCGAPALQVEAAYWQMPRATSDCKPWPAGGTLAVCGACGAAQKLDTPGWRSECRKIYSEYDIYWAAGGAEQVVFGLGEPVARSELLARQVAALVGTSGRALDIGCDTGSMIATLARVLPGWTCVGQDVADRLSGAVRALPQYEGYYRLLSSVPGRFGLITMVHTLEHVPDPVAALEAAAALLEPGGVLYVQVPDVEASPIDIAVADHRCHFSAQTLRLAAYRATLNVRSIGRTLPKELTLIADTGPAYPPRQYTIDRQIVPRQIAWLKAVLEQIKEIDGAVGIFGTSLGAMWLYGAISARVGCFLDEDVKKIGLTAYRRPILSPDEAPDVPVLMPLRPEVAQSVASRYPGVRWVLPPALEG